MSQIFILQPNLDLLNKYGCLRLNEFPVSDDGKIRVKCYPIQKPEERIALEDSFKMLVEKYEIDEHYDTLLYMVLLDIDYIEETLINLENSYIQNKRLQ